MPAVGMIVTAYAAGGLSWGGLVVWWLGGSLRRANRALRAAHAELAARAPFGVDRRRVGR